MDNQESCCCSQFGENENCLICGKPLVYFKIARPMECCICHKMKNADAMCEDGHFVCDECHSAGGAAILDFLMKSDERDPIKLYLQVCSMPQVHLHGPEHHSIVPCVLLTAYKNTAGLEDYSDCLNEAWRRGKKVPGGACGFLGACGAAIGSGIFISILSEAGPLTADVWDLPQRMTISALTPMVELGGPRCCKRTGRIAIEAAARFLKEEFKVGLETSNPRCSFSSRNRECLRERCPYFNPESGARLGRQPLL
ncbi:MAG: DUF5714 domain-containing protein [Candidatus Limivicinus sp.]